MSLPEPDLEDEDDVWLRWIEKQYFLDIRFGNYEDPDEQIEWLQRLTQLLNKSSTQDIRILDFDFQCEPSLCCSELSDVMCALITALHSQLEMVVFRSCNNQLFDTFCCVPTMPKLRTLDLSESDCTEQGELIADLVRKCPNLTDLNLCECRLDDDDVAAIGSVACPSLEILGVFCNNLTAHGMRSVAEMLKGCHQIRDVYFGNNEPEDDLRGTSEMLASLADKERLELLYFSGPSLVTDAVHHLQRMVNLRDLRMEFQGSDSEFECLCSTFRGMRHLSKLALEFERCFSPECDRLLVNLVCSNVNQWTTLHLTHLGGSDVAFSFSHLSEHVSSSNCRLRELRVGRGAGSDLLPLVSALVSNTSLTSFTISSNAFDDDFLLMLGQALFHNKTLREFSWDNMLSPQHWIMIVEGARYSTIARLKVSVSGPMTDAMHRLLDDVANQGYLVNVGDVLASESCKKRMELNKRMHNAARKAALMLLAGRKFRKSALNTLQKDVVKMVAMSLYATRANEAWSNTFGGREEPDQKRQKM